MIRRLAAPLLGFILAVAFLLDTRGLDEVARGDQLGPGFWPRLVLVGLALTCLGRVVGEWRRGRSGPSADPPPGDPAAANPGGPISRGTLAAAIALVILYTLAAPAIGFALATAGFIVAFMWLCGARSAVAIVANAVLGTVGLLYLFIKFVYLPLPKGAGLFETLSLVLYRALHLF